MWVPKTGHLVKRRCRISDVIHKEACCRTRVYTCVLLACQLWSFFSAGPRSRGDVGRGGRSVKPSVHCGSLRYLMVLFRLLMEASSYSLSPYRGGGVLGLHLAPMAISAAATGKLSAPGSASPTGEPDWVKTGNRRMSVRARSSWVHVPPPPPALLGPRSRSSLSFSIYEKRR